MQVSTSYIKNKNRTKQKSKQNKTKQNKTKQNKTKQNRANQSKAKQNKISKPNKILIHKLIISNKRKYVLLQQGSLHN